MWNKLFVTFLMCVLCSQQSSAQQSSPINIFGYYGDWSMYGLNYPVSQIPGDKITHLVYSFFHANPSQTDYNLLRGNSPSLNLNYDPTIPEGTLLPSDSYAWSLNVINLQQFKTKYPKVKILISVGGWTLSYNLGNIFNNQKSRATFVSSVMSLFAKHTFLDGLDIDWEYPGALGNTYNVYSLADIQGFGDVCRELQNAFKGRYILGAAMGAHPSKIINYKLGAPYLNFSNFMTYDFAGSWQQNSDHQSNFYGKTLNIQLVIDTAKQNGFKNIGIGTPFYARGWGCCPSDKIGAVCTCSPPNYDSMNGQVGYMDYKIVEQRLATGSYKDTYDDAAQAAYLTGLNEIWTYDNPKSIVYKCSQIISKNLSSIIIWQLPSDTATNVLLNAVNTYCSRPPSSKPPSSGSPSSGSPSSKPPSSKPPSSGPASSKPPSSGSASPSGYWSCRTCNKK